MQLVSARVKSVILRIALWWITGILGGVFLLILNSDDHIAYEQILLRAACVLAMLVSIELWKIERDDGKAITLNFAVLFGWIGVVIFLAETNSIKILVDVPIIAFFLGQYADALYSTLLLFCAAFLMAQVTMAGKSNFRKYIVAAVLSMSISVALHYPIILNPRYAYTVPDVIDFVSIDRAQEELRNRGISNLDAAVISEIISLPRWHGSTSVGELSPDERLKRIKEIQPYTIGSNYIILVNAPLRLMRLYVDALAAILVMASMVTSLVKDPPQGAYRDKIAPAFLVYLILEVIHEQSFREIVDWDLFHRIDGIGKLVTTASVLLIMFIEIRRYRFLLEGFGQYYESLLNNDPLKITRWIDGVDRFVLRYFFKNNSISRRFLQKNRENAFRKKTEKFRKNT